MELLVLLGKKRLIANTVALGLDKALYVPESQLPHLENGGDHGVGLAGMLCGGTGRDHECKGLAHSRCTIKWGRGLV